MAKRQKKEERTAPHRLNVYPSQWKQWRLQAAKEGLSVSRLVQLAMALYLDGPGRRK